MWGTNQLGKPPVNPGVFLGRCQVYVGYNLAT